MGMMERWQVRVWWLWPLWFLRVFGWLILRLLQVAFHGEQAVSSGVLQSRRVFLTQSSRLYSRKVRKKTRQRVVYQNIFAYDWIESTRWNSWQREVQFALWWQWQMVLAAGAHMRARSLLFLQEWAEFSTFWLFSIFPRLVWYQVQRTVLGFRRTVIVLYTLPRWVWLSSLLVGLSVSGSVWFYQSVLADLPSPQTLRSRQPVASTKIYDRNGELLYTIFKDQNRTIIPLSSVAPSAVQATLAIEDAGFYHHWGVSWRGMARAWWHNLRRDTVQGGSTITQQLVKNTLLTPERTWQRKVREIVLALAVDHLYTKDEILTGYLNEVNYGGSVYGIEEASHWYFGKSASELNLAESAFLAGLPQSPSQYSPFGESPDKAYERQREVLRRMEQEGWITTADRQAAEAVPLSFAGGNYEIRAPHFVMYVRSLLAEEFGEDVVTQGGLEVYTTLDLPTQASAEASVATELDRLGRLKVSNGAALVTNPRTGEILAMVGSRNYFDRSNDGQVNVVLRERQPGSSIKPLTYALAFERGYTPSTTIEDSPVSFTAKGAPPYAPKNYDGRFHGTVTLREALGSSYNIPAVRLLAELGVSTLVERGKALGITTWDDPARFGLALTLGGGEVKMIDMASVYGTFANGGMTVPTNPLLSVKRYDGKELYRNPCVATQPAQNQASSRSGATPCQGRRTLSSLAAYQLTSVLTDNAARTPAFGPRSQLYIPNQEVAVKTGTTNSLRDNWTIGYTSDRVVLTWVGNNDNRPMSAVASGVTGASPIWRAIMDSQLVGRTHVFAAFPGLEKVKICRLTRSLPCDVCPQVVEEVYPTGMAPKQACTPESVAAAYAARSQKTAVRQ